VDTIKITPGKAIAVYEEAGLLKSLLKLQYGDELPVGISFFGRAWSEPVLRY
jgi:hypothetical protein